MPNASPKVGKSLLKFFKPIRIGLPDQAQNGGFQLFKFKKPAVETKVSVEVKPEFNEIPRDHSILEPPKDNAPWLSVVVYLFDFCKKTSKKDRKKIGIRAYKNVMDTQVKQKMKIVGSIVNCTTDAYEEKEAMLRLEKEKTKIKKINQAA